MIENRLQIVLYTLLLNACASSTGPVTIRDSNGLRVDASQGDGAEQQRALAQPVLPSAPATPLPIVEKLVQQAQQQVAAYQYQRAIHTSERGLRINRKEARLYLVLAKAYRGLSNKRQSVYFAKQGLRYADRQTSVFARLKAMSR